MTSGLLGLGYDHKYCDAYQVPVGELVRRYRDRLSHLSVVGVEDASAATATIGSADGLPIVHHLSNVGVADPRGPDLDRLARLDALSTALDARWCCEDVGIWNIGPHALPYFLAPPLTGDVADFVADAIALVDRRSSVDFLAEVPYLPCIVGDLSLADFFTVVHDRSGAGLLLDVSHLWSYLLAGGDRTTVERFPYHAVREIHVAGGLIDAEHPARYVDTHSHGVLDEVMELVGEVVRRCDDLRAVTYEIGVNLDPQVLDADLGRIEGVLELAAFRPGVAA